MLQPWPPWHLFRITLQVSYDKWLHSLILKSLFRYYHFYNGMSPKSVYRILHLFFLYFIVNSSFKVSIGEFLVNFELVCKSLIKRFKYFKIIRILENFLWYLFYRTAARDCLCNFKMAKVQLSTYCSLFTNLCYFCY